MAPNIGLPPIKLNYELRPHQGQVLESLDRFNVLLAHRRFGKTVLAVILLILKAARCKHKSPRVHYFAPTYSQAKKVAWDYAKQFTSDWPGAVINESELRIDLPGDRRISLGSGDNPDASRGIYSDFVVLDEPAQMPSVLWTEVLRPALSDRHGGMLMIGTPKGRHGLFYDTYTLADTEEGWWRGMYPVSQTGIVDEAELHAARQVMTNEEYEQEYECSWSAAIKGAYYGQEFNVIEEQGRITSVGHDTALPVYTAWDLGITATAVWYFQASGFNSFQFLEYVEYSGLSFADIVRDMGLRPYKYGPAIVPHDVTQRSDITGKSRQYTLQQLGLETVVAPKVDVDDGIHEVKLKLGHCWFDRDKCKFGIEAMRQYRSDWDEKRGVLRKVPLHDWSSHCADAFRYFAITRNFQAHKWRTEPTYELMDQAVR